MDYLTCSFSPDMLAPEAKAEVQEVNPVHFKMWIEDLSLNVVIGEEDKAKMVCLFLGHKIDCYNDKLYLKKGDRVFCAIPQFKATEANFIEEDEIKKVGFRCFFVEIY